MEVEAAAAAAAAATEYYKNACEQPYSDLIMSMLRADLMHDNAHKDHPFFKHIAPAKTIYGSEDETKAAFYEGNPHSIICD